MRSTTNWFNLPFELKANILSRIGALDKLENVQKVCTDWFKVCKDPSVWKVIDLYSSSQNVDLPKLRKMCKHAVDRSQGQLVDIFIPRLANDEVLMYVADRASQLKRLIISCGLRDSSIESLVEALKKFPLLEELFVLSIQPTKAAIESAGRYCPLLKKLVVTEEPSGFTFGLIPRDDEILVNIGDNLHELTHLELMNNVLSDNGLKVLLNGCPHLESLDLSLCWNVGLKEDIVKRCSEQIKRLTLPTPYRDSDSDSDHDHDHDHDPEYYEKM